MFEMNEKDADYVSIEESTKKSFSAEMQERCSARKLASVAGIAVLGYVIETGLKVLAGVTTD